MLGGNDDGLPTIRQSPGEDQAKCQVYHIEAARQLLRPTKERQLSRPFPFRPPIPS